MADRASSLPLKRVGIVLAALATVLTLCVNASAEYPRPTTKEGVLAPTTAVRSVIPLAPNPTCLGQTSSRWARTLTSQVTSLASVLQSGGMPTYGSVGLGETTRRNGSPILRAHHAQICGVAMTSAARDQGSFGFGTAPEVLAAYASPADPPSYLPWYTSTPAPIPGAYVSIAGAFGAGNFYNTSTAGGAVGTGMLNTGKCLFICFGAPGMASHHVLVYGNDFAPGNPGTSFTHHGAADDCFKACPGLISNQVFSVTTEPRENDYFVALDGAGNLGVLSSLYAGAAVIAGAGTGTPEPSPSAGSLVSYTGPGEGDILLGTNAFANYVKCDFGETQNSTLTCNKPLVISTGPTSAGLNGSGIVWAMGGVQPNSTSGGFTPEAFPLGVTAAHPRIMSGSCAVTGSGACTFSNGFAFIDTTYNCTLTAQGMTPVADSYAKTATDQITIYTGTLTLHTFSYICIR
jgi:hypothetical protein